MLWGIKQNFVLKENILRSQFDVCLEATFEDTFYGINNFIFLFYSALMEYYTSYNEQ